MRNEKIAPDTERDATESARRSEEKKPAEAKQFRIAEVRDTDAVLEMEDGRVFIATIPEGMDKSDLRKGAIATIKSDGLDKSEAPENASITKAIPASEAKD